MATVEQKQRRGEKLKFSAPESARFDRTKVQQYGEVLADIEARDGMLTPEAVVQAARNPRSVIHDIFNWDDESAAEQHRLTQARTFIRWIKVEIRYVGKRTAQVLRPKFVRAFSHVVEPQSSNRGYVNITTVQANAEYRRQVVESIVQNIESLADKLATFKNLDKYAVKLREVAAAIHNAA